MPSRPRSVLGSSFLAIILMTGLLGACSWASPAQSVTTHRNVILMINDGASPGTWAAADAWMTGQDGSLPLHDFPVHLGVTTYPLNTALAPTFDETELCGYDPVQAWDPAPDPTGAYPFLGYRYLAEAGVTDSATAATALASGIKTYNSALNVDNRGSPVDFLTLQAHRAGLVTGVVTSVDFCHATPAAFAVQEASRSNYLGIAHQMLGSGTVDLIMGGGHPLYNADGVPRSPVYNRISEADWLALQAGTLYPEGSASPWALVETKAAFEALAAGQTGTLPLFGLVPVASTLQQERSLAVQGPDSSRPSGVSYLSTVPSLATMAKAALETVSQPNRGFFLMIEGGATDWAAHAHQAGRLVEEAAEFDLAVQAVYAWLQSSPYGKDTLLIVTADHGNSLVLGSQAGTVAFAPVENRGRGVMPGLTFGSTGHTDELVPLWAWGPGAQQLSSMVRGTAPGFRDHVGINDGSYIDNTDVYRAMRLFLGL